MRYETGRELVNCGECWLVSIDAVNGLLGATILGSCMCSLSKVSPELATDDLISPVRQLRSTGRALPDWSASCCCHLTPVL